MGEVKSIIGSCKFLKRRPTHHSSPRRAEKENVSISIILKERSPILQYVAQLLWNLADISMLKRLIRARLSQTQQKTEITWSAIICYSTEIFRFHRIFDIGTLFIQPF